MNEEEVFAIQRFYPQIYLACHADHIRASSTRWRLSSHDSSILAHLDRMDGMSPRDLRQHLGVAPSSLSASLKRLTGLGYITNEPDADDKRKREIRLTDRGMKAMQETSVLNTAKLREILLHLTADERRDAIRGLELLANAARLYEEQTR
ncbi:MAG TPA: MarR family winged helix-turn-helix transcriptional regulator [Pyrinomonadaceae bacterium]|nr:MarR family winged helix-turn-helix transcriptional regulator [Pyrinomonadaceae bacterium]